jgi:phenylpropionate dioxygenase-like ring-hydroxylating dioxygenase large terminal subunit
LEDAGIDGKNVKWIVKKWNVVMDTGFIWLWMGSSGGV